MPRPRLILHIGTHKTGTSSLQAALGDARDTLLSHGVLYPRTDRPPIPDSPRHCSVFQAATSKDPLVQEAERATLCQEFAASGAHTMLLSEEGLSDPGERVCRFIAGFSRDFDLHVVCYLRRQDLFVEALFNQFVRESVRRESRPILTFTRAPTIRARMDYHTMLARWAALPAQMTVVDFAAVAREPGLMPSFEAAIGLPGLGLPERRANSSPDMRLAVALNRMNRQRVDYDVHSLVNAARCLSQLGERPIRHLLGRDERLRLLDEFEPSNRRLAADFGVTFSSDLPADESSHAVEDLDPHFLLQLLGGVSRAANESRTSRQTVTAKTS